MVMAALTHRRCRPASRARRVLQLTFPLFVALAGCGSGATSSGDAGAGGPPSVTRAPHVIATLAVPAGIVHRSGHGLHIGAAVAGSASSGDPAVLRDQAGLINASQTTDDRFYPSGYHWRVSPDLQPGDVVSTALVSGQAGQVAIDITLTDKGAAALRAIAEAAAGAPQGSATNRIAFFSGADVVSAPQVLSPPNGNITEITTDGLTLQQAAQVAVDLAPG